MLQYSLERHLKDHKVIVENIQDLLITKILEESEANESESDSKIFALIGNMKDLGRMSTTLLKYINRISDDELASHLIRTILHHKRVDEVPIEQIEQLKTYLSDISLYANIGKAISMIEFLPYDAWTKVMEMNRVAPERLLSSLIERNQYELCYQWLQTVSLQAVVIKPQFIDLFMDKITYNSDNNDEHFIKVCEMLLKFIVVRMDSTFLLRLRNRKLLQYIVDFLMNNSTDYNQVYKNYKIALCIFETIDDTKEVDSLWNLVEMPLLIVEQYILNSKFQTLSKILSAIRPLLKNDECKLCSKTLDNLSENAESLKEHTDDTSIHSSQINYREHSTSIQCIDYILRVYAGKALDFRIGNGDLMAENISSPKEDGEETSSLTFIIPREAPEKTNWIKDVEASHCMCCKKSVFTMLTRRHHCRRCGRVICHTCSTKRLFIPKLYENILVRVCDDCFRQTNEAQTMNVENVTNEPIESVMSSMSTVSTSAETHELPIGRRDGWTYRFSGHLKHDNLLRGEFAFEYAPSASLCLNLLSLHTPGQMCCDFLLSYCKKFEALLKPLKPGQSNPEVDYAFVTRILYCLSFAAKVMHLVLLITCVGRN